MNTKKTCLTLLKIFALALVAVVLISAPFFTVFVYIFSLPCQYSDTYLAALTDKYARLNEIKESKIVLVGGSNLPFGINSALIEEHLNRPVVNFGLYGALGTKTILDLSKRGIRSGDTVVLAIEYAEQMYSLFTDGKIMLQAFDDNSRLLTDVPFEDYTELLMKFPEFASQKYGFYKDGNAPKPAAPYSRDSFNEYGDIDGALRPYNIMPDLYDPNTKASFDINGISKKFVDYFNDYVDFAQKKGAEVVISFPPLNRLALSGKQDQETLSKFYDHVRDTFDAEVISHPSDYIFDEGYFYDSNYHLNAGGSTLRSVRLIEDLKRHYRDYSATETDIPPPSGADPEKPNYEETDYISDPARYFLYEENNNGITVTGLSQDGLSRAEIKIPIEIDGKTVYGISDNAFSGNADIEEITIPESVTVLGARLFANCPKLKSVYLALSRKTEDRLPSVGVELLNGANENLKIYVPKEKLSIMMTDYFWSVYTLRLATSSD